jgi:hypothetical protein
MELRDAQGQNVWTIGSTKICIELSLKSWERCGSVKRHFRRLHTAILLSFRTVTLASVEAPVGANHLLGRKW